MPERLGDPARRATAQAEAEARLLHHGYLETEHLVLGVIADVDDAVAWANGFIARTTR